MKYFVYSTCYCRFDICFGSQSPKSKRGKRKVGTFERQLCHLSVLFALQQCKGIQYDLLPYPDKNDQFIVCAYEVPEVRSCLQSTCFDPILKSCSERACTPTTPSDKEIAVTFCNELKAGEKIPSVDCSHFWICLIEMEPVYVACPLGKHYSRSEQECVSPALAKCATPAKLCESNYSTYAAESCNEYYGCTNKNLMKRSCPYGEAYSAESAACIKDWSCVADLKPDCQNPANANAYFSHSDCTKFYVCIQSQVFEGKCADGYGFDRQSSNCRLGICKSN
ncbi:uncharacterized protein LOC135433261 [Drosophila montana]|uniref:uncharacterized protein LOC135433261 n=1 Tax=Drosophila montana TaxID=40370 RepID=UPI00313AE1E0